MVQPLRLPQLEDFAVVERVDFVLEQLQGRGLTGQSPGDLLPHHLHHLETRSSQTAEVQLETRSWTASIWFVNRSSRRDNVDSGVCYGGVVTSAAHG